MTLDDYCRELEAHLCRQSGGHLIRIVGPSFETVREWERLGIPLKVAMRGIDQHIERLESRGRRAQPVRIEYCDGDVRRVFEQWRRAVGLRTPSGDADDLPADVAPAARRQSLSGHIERVIVRLTVLRSGAADPEWERAIEEAVRELDALRASARKARGDARVAIVADLARTDRRLMETARRTVPPALAAEVTAEAERELEPFRERLRPDAWNDAVQRGCDVVLRERLGLPVVEFD
jgi:hypothetical protein